MSLAPNRQITARDTVAEAIKMLEDAGILTWCNRRARVRIGAKLLRLVSVFGWRGPTTSRIASSASL
jgi:hypothetical protein